MIEPSVHLSALKELSLPGLYRAFAATGQIRRLLELAYTEDLGERAPTTIARPIPAGSGDVTSDCSIDPARSAVGSVIARAGGTVAGLEVFPELISIFAPSVMFTLHARDGDCVPAMTPLAELRGPLDEMLGLERTLLNILGRLCGVATRTAQFVRTLPPGCRAKIYDTRKTTPGLRLLEKYAVRCGGGYNHRIGLYDAVLLKDNHLAGTTPATLAGFVAGAAARARELRSGRDGVGGVAFVQVEVDTLEQFAALLTLPKGTLDIVLLDNMGPPLLTRAVAMRAAAGFVHEGPGGLELEASGGVTLETIGAIAATGVDRISIGGLTHSAVVLDVALDIIETTQARAGTAGDGARP